MEIYEGYFFDSAFKKNGRLKKWPSKKAMSNMFRLVYEKLEKSGYKIKIEEEYDEEYDESAYWMIVRW